MIRLALRGLATRKLRSLLTALAIVLGVATVSGTYVLTDSIRSAFDTIFSSVYRGTDAAITGKSALSATTNTNLPPFDESLLAKVKELPGVAAATGGVADETTNLIGKNGKVISFGFAPHLGFSVDPDQPQFSSLTLVDGEWPGRGEVVIDRSTARKKNIEVGDTVPVEAQGPATPFKVSGLVKFGTSSLDIGGATLAGFDLETAQKLFRKEGKLDQIRVARKPGITTAELLRQIRGILPPQTQVRSGQAQATEDANDTNSFTSFLQTFLLSFGGIALFVGSFVIANSLSITVAQRTREFATLRTIGASRRQLLRSVLVESLVLGVLASVTGLFLGLGLAKLLFWVFDKAGLTLANSGLLLQTRTVIVALLVGVLVTVVASLRPAMRATRVPPIAAVREGVNSHRAASHDGALLRRERSPSSGSASSRWGSSRAACRLRRSCSRWASARCLSSSASLFSRRSSSCRLHTSLAARQRVSPGPRECSPARTRCGTRSERARWLPHS